MERNNLTFRENSYRFMGAIRPMQQLKNVSDTWRMARERDKIHG